MPQELPTVDCLDSWARILVVVPGMLWEAVMWTTKILLGSTDWESNTADTVTSAWGKGGQEEREKEKEGGGEEWKRKGEGEEGRERWRREGKRRKRRKEKKDKRNEPLHSLLHGLIPRTGDTAWVWDHQPTFLRLVLADGKFSPSELQLQVEKLKQSTWQLQENTNISSSLLSSPLISSSSSLCRISSLAVRSFLPPVFCKWL